jgi:hypothetical protein
MAERTGPGIRVGVPLTPDEIAKRLENLARGRARAAGRPKEDAAKLAVEVAGMDLDTIRKTLSVRNLSVAMLHCGGYNPAQIGKAIGYATSEVAKRALERPDVKRCIQLIQQAQMDRVISGEFGVQAAAKAAAPRVAKRIIEKAGGVEDANGRPVGQAARDADMLRAGETVLRISGDLDDTRRGDVNITLLGKLDNEEMQAFVEDGVWPERFRHIQKTLEIDGPPAPIDVTPSR